MGVQDQDEGMTQKKEKGQWESQDHLIKRGKLFQTDFNQRFRRGVSRGATQAWQL